MRGEKEARCFDILKNALFYKDGAPVCNIFNGGSAFTVDENLFMADPFSYCNPAFCKIFFGLLESERKEFLNIIRVARPNSSSSEFPDFTFKNGFIEHFQITSSKTTQKGATHARKEAAFQRRVERETEKLKVLWDENPCFEEIRSESWEFQNPEHSHDFLMTSFKQNWERHLESRANYSGNKDIGIFMVEYPEMALAMAENIYCGWVDGMSSGDMREGEKFKEYRLSRDKELLNYIHDFKDTIKYVIFVNNARCEVIRTENIPHLLCIMPWDYLIYPELVITVSTVSCITRSKSFAKEETGNGKTC